MNGKYTGANRAEINTHIPLSTVFVSVAALFNIFFSYLLLPYWLAFWLSDACDDLTPSSAVANSTYDQSVY